MTERNPQGTVEPTRFGFIWDGLTVERVCEGTFGYILALEVAGQRHEVRITLAGKKVEVRHV